MKSFYQMLVIVVISLCLKIITCKPIFKGISLKKNYEMEISAIPFKHLSFIKEKWLPFKMIGIKHDIAKRDVNLNDMYSVNEVAIDEENEKFPGLLTSVRRNLDLNSEDHNPAPIEESIESIHLSSNQVTGPKNVVDSVVHTSSFVPLSPNIIIAPSIKTMGSILDPSVVLPIAPELVIPLSSKEVEVHPLSPPPPPPPEPKAEVALNILPMHTHIDVLPEEKPVENISKMHTDISSVVPMNTLVAPPIEEVVVPLSIGKVETPVEETPKLENPVDIPKNEAPIHAPPVEITNLELPIRTPILEPIPGNKTGPPGLFMRGTRLVLYFGSVMLQLLSQMLSSGHSNVSQLAEPFTL